MDGPDGSVEEEERDEEVVAEEEEEEEDEMLETEEPEEPEEEEATCAHAGCERSGSGGARARHLDDDAADLITRTPPVLCGAQGLADIARHVIQHLGTLK